MNPETYEPVEPERLRRLGQARPSAEVEARIVRGTFARMERRSSRRWTPALVTAAATAAAAMAFFVGRPAPDEGPAVAAITTGSALVAEAEARTFAVGAHEVVVAPASRLVVERLEGQGALLRLEKGEASFAVEPLSGGERFRVVTGHASVEVIGTRFTVREDADCTVVSVSRGKVHAGGREGTARFLGAGETARFCAAEAPVAEALPGEASVREAIRLLSEGRDLARAADLLGRYRTAHPDGVFQEEALYHLCRIEAQLGRADRAEALADEFVARFPASARAGRIRHWCAPGR